MGKQNNQSRSKSWSQDGKKGKNNNNNNKNNNKTKKSGTMSIEKLKFVTGDSSENI